MYKTGFIGISSPRRTCSGSLKTSDIAVRSLDTGNWTRDTPSTAHDWLPRATRPLKRRDYGDHFNLREIKVDSHSASSTIGDVSKRRNALGTITRIDRGSNLSLMFLLRRQMAADSSEWRHGQINRGSSGFRRHRRVRSLWCSSVRSTPSSTYISQDIVNLTRYDVGIQKEELPFTRDP